jgi:hypothetical protein
MLEAPRWRLITGHYLNVPELPDGTKVEWEHKETNRANGRTVRKLYPVPMLFDPNDPADHNYPGEIIVAHAVDGARNERNDLIFFGDPTPDMECLNDAAETITNALRPKWEHPIDTLPVNGGMSSHEQAFMESMMAAFAKQVGANLPTANASVDSTEMAELKERLAKLEALLTAQTKAPEAPARRV